MHTFEASELLPGDIILTRDKSSSTSWIIRGGTLSEYSHSILYVGGHSFIDSDMGGVHSNNLQRLILEHSDDAAVRRYTHTLSSSVIDDICRYARAQVGQRYSKQEAVRTALPNIKRIATEKQFCSRLVAQAYAAAGHPIVENADFCTPKQIGASPLLTEVFDVIRRATAQEIAFATDTRRNGLKRQEDITNNVLADIRAASGTEISTLSEAFHLAAQNPRLDPMIAEIFRSSGYLTMWEFDMELNPHWYDAEAYRSAIPVSEQKRQAEVMLPPALEMLRRFSDNLQIIRNTNKIYPSETGKLFDALEQKLCDVTSQRIAVLQQFV